MPQYVCASMKSGLFDSMTVSYTHLDDAVVGIQFGGEVLGGKQRVVVGDLFVVHASAGERCGIPVSYTHLDVYKRQDPKSTRIFPAFIPAIISLRAFSEVASWMNRTSLWGMPGIS